MKRSISLVLIVTALLFTAVINGNDGTQTTGPDTYILVTDNGMSDFNATSENSQGFTEFSGVRFVVWFPGNDAILINANLSFKADEYLIRSHKPYDLYLDRAFRSTDAHFG